MVTLTLFFIGTAPMITIDSCTHFYMDSATEKTTLATFFPKPNLDLIFTDTAIWSIDEERNATNDGANPANENISDVLTENTKDNQLPYNSFPAPYPKNIHFFEKYLITGSPDMPFAKISRSLVHYKSNV